MDIDFRIDSQCLYYYQAQEVMQHFNINRDCPVDLVFFNRAIVALKNSRNNRYQCFCESFCDARIFYLPEFFFQIIEQSYLDSLSPTLTIITLPTLQLTLYNYISTIVKNITKYTLNTKYSNLKSTFLYSLCVH